MVVHYQKCFLYEVVVEVAPFPQSPKAGKNQEKKRQEQEYKKLSNQFQLKICLNISHHEKGEQKQVMQSGLIYNKYEVYRKIKVVKLGHLVYFFLTYIHIYLNGRDYSQ